MVPGQQARGGAGSLSTLQGPQMAWAGSEVGVGRRPVLRVDGNGGMVLWPRVSSRAFPRPMGLGSVPAS